MGVKERQKAQKQKAGESSNNSEVNTSKDELMLNLGNAKGPSLYLK